MAKAAPKRKAANGYTLAERLPRNEILEDINKKRWKLGSPIGQGGFGEIYEAQEANSSGSSYPYVIKIEPHSNGPLFVEMHFYMRNAKPADIENFKTEKGLKSFGMPLYLGSGSHEFKNQKYRFVVMEKFGTDLWKIFLENNRVFPPDTVFKLGIQILDVLEYIHKRGYVHADIKGANILLGVMKGVKNQIYLVDFGLATKFTTEKEFKSNPKKAHDGTIEYLSRDAHKGVQTRRGDLEILAYNLIQWLGGTLPWESDLKDPNIVHKAKEENMNNITKMIKACFRQKAPPEALVNYLNYLKNVKFNEEPDYQKIHKIFISGIKDAGGSENSPLKFSIAKNTPKKRKSGHLTSPPPQRKMLRGRNTKKPSENEIATLKDESDHDLSSLSVDQKVMESDNEDIIESSFEKQKVSKKAKKKPAKIKKIKDKFDAPTTEDNKVTKVSKKNNVTSVKNTKKENKIEQSFEGYTDAMKEIMMKKLQNGKSKDKKKLATSEDNMAGFTDSMKELAAKKKERLAVKKVPKNKKKMKTEEELQTERRGRRLRAPKKDCNDE